jgi:hypothetical protein
MVPSRLLIALALTGVFCCPIFAGQKQKLKVTIIERQNSQTSYSGVVPGRSTATTNGNANCYAYGNTANCTATSTTQSVNTPARRVGYDVQGATFTLKLPDGRVAVVNCASKYSPKGDYVNRRSCRVPLVNELEAEFEGNNAKLKWPVSLDGRKMESETYKVLGVFAE